MLASIHPLGERARHSRWGITVTAYVLGSVGGGAGAGAVLGAVGAAAFALLPAPAAVRVWSVAGACLLAAAVELGAGGLRLPSRRSPGDGRRQRGGGMARLRGHGLKMDLAPGWEGHISRRAPGPGETTHPVLHAATFALPPERGDFGGGAVELMAPEDILVTLLEHHPDSAGTALFAASGPPWPLTIDRFSPTSLQRMLPGQAGTQSF